MPNLVSPATAYKRISRGWDHDDAWTCPPDVPLVGVESREGRRQAIGRYVARRGQGGCCDRGNLVLYRSRLRCQRRQDGALLPASRDSLAAWRVTRTEGVGIEGYQRVQQEGTMSHNDLTMVLTGLHSDEPCSRLGAWGAVMSVLFDMEFVTA